MPFLPANKLLSPRRLDLIIKWRFFRHLMTGDDGDAERLYRWHVKKRTTINRPPGMRLSAAKKLYESILKNGFNPSFSVPVDQNGELLDGGHRTACCLALGEKVHVVTREGQAWAPPWGIEWFEKKGMAEDDLARLRSDFDSLSRL